MTELPPNLARLHEGEELLRGRASKVIAADERLRLHLLVTENAMDLLDLLRQVEGADEDLKVLQALGMRLFNDFGAAVKLALSGYSQQAALLLRDILETCFLLDLFSHDPAAITRWRHADRKIRLRDFKPIKVRELLDQRDGFTTKKRAEQYELFSELAGHASMPSFAMLRPKGMDAQIGPFIDPSVVEAVLSEMGKLAIQVGGIIVAFFPTGFRLADDARARFATNQKRWLARFYGGPNGEVSGHV